MKRGSKDVLEEDLSSKVSSYSMIIRRLEVKAYRIRIREQLTKTSVGFPQEEQVEESDSCHDPVDDSTLPRLISHSISHDILCRLRNMSQTNGKRKKKYSYHGHQNKKQLRTQMFEDGMKGLLITCNNREFEAVRETYNIVQQFIDKQSEEKDSKAPVEEDLDKAIQAEVSELKSKKEVSYRQVDTRCNNVIFVNIMQESVDPMAVVSSLFENTKNSCREAKVRFVNRITPVSKTCKATVESTTKCVEGILGEKNDCQEGSFMVLVKIRNNNQLHQTEFIEGVAAKVKELRPKWKVDFSNPKTTICIDILIKACCVGFLPDFFGLKKYNILEYASHLKKEAKGEDNLLNVQTDFKSGETEITEPGNQGSSNEDTSSKNHS